MDTLTKKFVLQLDDLTPGVYTQALEKARQNMAKATPPETFRGFVQDIENAQTAKKRVSDLEAEVRAKNALIQQLIAANKKAQFHYVAAQKVLEWVSVHRRPVAAGAAAVVFGLIGIKSVPAVRASWSLSVADKAALQSLASAKPWREGWTHPVIESLNTGAIIWIATKGTIDRNSYADVTGQTIEKRCLHLYASRASPVFGDYIQPDAFDWSGSIKWPEVAMYCSRAPRPMEIAGPGTPRPLDTSPVPGAVKPREGVDFGPGKPIPPAKKGRRE